MSANLPEKPASASFATMTEYVLPQHANALGNVFGGQILAWMDLCAAICAQRHCGNIAVTAGIDELSFELPIKVGQVVRLSARVTATFKSSLEVAVEVDGENPTSGRIWHCVSAFVTFVSIDGDGHPRPVPPLLCENEEDKQLSDAANARRAHRLAHRPQTK